MENVTPTKRIHPLIGVAAVAVTLVSLVGVAAITGLLPTSRGENSAPISAQISPPNESEQAAQQQPMQSGATAEPPQLMANSQLQYPQTAPAGAPPLAPCENCGHVESIRAVQHPPQASGVGIMAGALLGGILGHQIGAGNGRTLATVAGAGAGGYAGNEVEKHSRTSISYVIDVRMDNGKLRAFPQTVANWHIGDPVRVVHGHLASIG